MEIPVRVETTKTVHPLRVRLSVPIDEVGAHDMVVGQKVVDHFRRGLEDLVREAFKEYGVVLTHPEGRMERDSSSFVTTLLFDIGYALINEPSSRGDVIRVEGSR